MLPIQPTSKVGLRLGALFVLGTIAAVVAGMLYLWTASAGGAVHGIGFFKGCDTPTNVGDPYSCTYLVNSPADPDTLTFNGISDVVHASPDVPSAPNILPLLTVDSTAGGAFCEDTSTVLTTGGTGILGSGTAPIAKCTLPTGGAASITFNPYSFYNTDGDDPNPLTDTATLTWRDTCNNTVGGNCNPNVDLQSPATSQTVLQTQTSTPTATATATPTSTATSTATNTATNTATKTATRTATRSPTPTATPGQKRPGPAMELQVYADLAKQQLVCDVGLTGRNCFLPTNSTFSVDVKASTPPGGFRGYQIVLRFSGALALLQQDGLAENRWPGCRGGFYGSESYLAPTNNLPGRYIIACKGPLQKYKGVLANIHFACTGDGQIDIIGGGGSQVSFFDRPSIFGNRIFLPSTLKGNAQVADSVHIRCGQLLRAGATDSDGDGCGDKSEQGSDERLGGRRDPANPWDFFDPNGDGRHGLDDILAVIQHYNQDSKSEGYSSVFDRTFVGPNSWNLGPPDGMIDMDDIREIVSLYGQNCA